MNSVLNLLIANCKSTSNKSEFGICDDMNLSPAYIDELRQAAWIAVVKNNLGREVEFYAIDNCVKILREDGRQESSCDGILKADSELVFIELKLSGRTGWFGEGRKQLEKTIEVF